MKVVIATLLLALAVQIGGCGDSEEATSAPEETTTKQAKAQAERPTENLWEPERTPAEEAQLEKEYADASRWRVLKKAAGDKASRLIVPLGPPPEKKIVIRDLRKGKGPTLDKNDQFMFESLAFDYSEANLGEDSWGEEGSWWVYGTGEMNEGLEAGFKGMQAGGIREMVIPAARLHDDDAAVYLVRLTRIAKE